MATAHTDGEPPSTGSTILANIGCTENSSSAERNVVAVNAQRTKLDPSGAAGAAGVGARSGFAFSAASMLVSGMPRNSLRKGRPLMRRRRPTHTPIAWPVFAIRDVVAPHLDRCQILAWPLRAAEYKARHCYHNKDHDRAMSGAAAGSERQGGILEAEAFARAMPAGARLMGLDLGTKTLGLALSDVTRTIASGLTTLSRTKFSADVRQLLELAGRHGVGGFVIGLPLNLDGSGGPRAQATRAFARNLSKMTPIPILYWDERLSTAEAERMLLEADLSRRRRAQVVDKVAATLILQSALDRLKLFTSV